LKQHNLITEVTWTRSDPHKYSYSDYLNEQSKIKIWKCAKSYPSDQEAKQIINIDIFNEISKKYQKFTPSTKSLLDASVSPAEPPSFDILKTLFIDKFCMKSIK
jgi:hypothetical protein